MAKNAVYQPYSDKPKHVPCKYIMHHMRYYNIIKCDSCQRIVAENPNGKYESFEWQIKISLQFEMNATA